MTTTVAIFDEEQKLERTLKRLDEAGLDPEAITVLDAVRERAARAGEPHPAAVPGAGDAALPGGAPTYAHPGLAAASPDERSRAARSFLEDRIDSREAVSFYCRTLEREGSLLVVDAADIEVEELARIRREGGASRVAVHE